MDKISRMIDEEIAAKKPHYPTLEALLLPCLHVAQDELGWVSDEVLGLIAEKLALPKAKVIQVTSFYTWFSMKRRGKKHIQVCNNISCWLRGSESLIHYIEEKLDIRLGETTKDGAFTLNEVECLGSCDTAPVLQLNDDYIESLTKADIDTILSSEQL